MAISSRRPTRTRTRTRPRFTLLVLVLASITILTLWYRGAANHWLNGAKGWAADVFAPVQTAVTGAFRPVANFFEGAASYGSLKAQNAKLRQEVTALRAQSALASTYRRQAQALEAQQHLAFAGTLHQVLTDVVAGSPSNFQDTIELDKGTRAGIQVGMPAVSGTGLVGRVIAVSARTSTVLLVTDPTSAVGVRFGSHGTLALAKGQGQGRSLTVDLVDPGTRLVKGEVMVTSGGQGDLYPPGIPVGRVESASVSPGSLQENVTLKPFVNLDQLEFVSVLKWTPQRGAVP